MVCSPESSFFSVPTPGHCLWPGPPRLWPGRFSVASKLVSGWGFASVCPLQVPTCQASAHVLSVAQGPRTGSLTSFPSAPCPVGAGQLAGPVLPPSGPRVRGSLRPSPPSVCLLPSLLSLGKKLFFLVPGQVSLPCRGSLPTGLPCPPPPSPFFSPAPRPAPWVPTCVTPASYVATAVVHGSPQLQTPRGQGSVPVLSAPPAGGRGLAPTWLTSTSTEENRRSSRAAGRGASAERDAQTPSSTHVDPAPALHRRTPSDSPYGRATVPTRLPGASKNWPQLFPLQGPLKSVRFPPESPRAWEQGSLPLALLLVHPPSTHQPANFGDPTRITSPPILKPLPQLPAPPGPALPFLRSLPQGDPLCPRSSLGRHCLPWLHVASSGNSPLLPRTG